MLSLMTELGAPLRVDDAFADLGSGLGKAVLQVLLTTRVGSAVGVELAEDRVSLAISALQTVRRTLGASAERAKFVLADLRATEHWSDATMVYTASLCFPASIMLQMSELLASTLPPGSPSMILQFLC
eukprot:4427496-Amphidinium_carterae.1